MVKVKLPKAIQFSVSLADKPAFLAWLIDSQMKIYYLPDDFMTFSFHSGFLYVYIHYETACKIVNYLKQVISNTINSGMISDCNMVIKRITKEIADSTEFEEGDDNERS